MEPADSAGPSAFKSRGGLRRIVNATRYSAAGLKAAFRHEAAFRQELLLFAVLLPIALLVPVSLLERTLLIAPMFLVLIVEVLNSAIEALADTITREHHPLIGRAKDLGSAAVMIALAACALCWVGIGIPVLINLLR